MLIQNLIISCLFALAPISNVPVQDQQSNVQEVEKKPKSNYYHEDNVDDVIIYSQSELTCDEYWLGMISFYRENPTFVLPGGKNNTSGNNVTADDFLHGLQWDADSTSLSNCYFYDFNTNTNSFDKLSTSGYKLTGMSLHVTSSTANTIVINMDLVVSFIGSSSTYRVLTTISRFDLNYVASKFLKVNGDDIWSYGRCIGISAFCACAVALDYDYYYQLGYDSGYQTGYNTGYSTGQSDAQDPSSSIYQGIYQTGYADGLQQGQSQGDVATTIFSGFIEVGLLPVNVLLKMFEYEVFGINIAGLISGLITLAIGIIIIRTITGKKND